MAPGKDANVAVRRAWSKLEAAQTELDGAGVRIESDEWLLLRARLGAHLAAFNRELGAVDDAFGMTSAQDRILRLLQMRSGTVVTKEEISGVAGITAWARRVRELREDHGWVIHTVHTMPGLRPGEYVLVGDRPNPALASAWLRARSLAKRKTRGGLPPAKARVLEFLKGEYPRASDMALLAHVAGSTQAALAAIADLELDGWSIARAPDDDSFAPAGYALQDIRQRMA